MTREEAISIIKEAPLYNDTTWEFANKLHEAINTLEQKPMLDKIRAEVLEYIDDLDVAYNICEVFDKYKTESEEINE